MSLNNRYQVLLLEHYSVEIPYCGGCKIPQSEDLTEKSSSLSSETLEI